MATRKYSLQQVLKMDQYLMQLAAYESTQGMIRVPKTYDDAMDFQKDIAKYFNYFKRLIQNNECTFEELEQMVLKRHGPIPNPYHSISMSEALKKMSQEQPAEKEDQQPDESEQMLSMIMQSLKNSLPEGAIMVTHDPNGAPSFLIPQDGLRGQPPMTRIPPEAIQVIDAEDTNDDMTDMTDIDPTTDLPPSKPSKIQIQQEETIDQKDGTKNARKKNKEAKGKSLKSQKNRKKNP